MGAFGVQLPADQIESHWAPIELGFHVGAKGWEAGELAYLLKEVVGDSGRAEANRDVAGWKSGNSGKGRCRCC